MIVMTKQMIGVMTKQMIGDAGSAGRCVATRSLGRSGYDYVTPAGTGRGIFKRRRHSKSNFRGREEAHEILSTQNLLWWWDYEQRTEEQDDLEGHPASV